MKAVKHTSGKKKQTKSTIKSLAVSVNKQKPTNIG